MSQITGLAETLARLANYQSSVVAKAKEEIAFTALEILNEAKENTPIDTGVLRGSGSMEITDNGMNAKVSFSAEYAPFIEFGTGGFVTVPTGWEDFAIQFKGKGVKKINLTARPYLLPVYEKGVIGLKDRLLKLTNENRTI